MTIQFYLNDEAETLIHTMYDMVSNPFSIGDVLNLSVSDIPPMKYMGLKSSVITTMEEEHKKLKVLFNRRSVKIVKEGKYIDIQDGRFTIEYHCEIVEE